MYSEDVRAAFERLQTTKATSDQGRRVPLPSRAELQEAASDMRWLATLAESMGWPTWASHLEESAALLEKCANVAS